MGNMGTYTGLYGELYEIPWDFCGVRRIDLRDVDLPLNHREGPNPPSENWKGPK